MVPTVLLGVVGCCGLTLRKCSKSVLLVAVLRAAGNTGSIVAVVGLALFVAVFGLGAGNLGTLGAASQT